MRTREVDAAGDTVRFGGARTGRRMERDVIWAPAAAPGLEHLRVTLGDAADGVVIGLDDGGRPFRLRYHVGCDECWRVREVCVTLLDGRAPGVDLRADGDGCWTTDAGTPVPALDGCIDLDLSATPFTNTLPIRRLGLRPGESAEIAAAYVVAPELTLEAVRQRYTCLAAGPDGGRYRYESLPDDPLRQPFVAELTVDADGLVIDYPGLFRRLWSG